MPSRIEDIHAPSIASSIIPPTNESSQNTTTDARKALLALISQRDNIQNELSALSRVLESHNADMATPLLTPDGYPRADIDVPQIRTTRARIIRLKNDYKWTMEKIERGLDEIHAQAAAFPDQEPQMEDKKDEIEHTIQKADETVNPEKIEVGRRRDVPFAKVNAVTAESPADDAGLKVGDVILLFGDVDYTNHENLTRVAKVVQDNEGREVKIKIRRQDTGSENAQMMTIDLVISPRHNWGGRGMLGCHLLPI